MHDTLIMLGRLLLAGFLGGVVGYEREVHEHPAGLRTHILVCMGSALITLVSMSFPNDQSRIAAQIVSGIGFLGAGTILRQGSVVRGLTTAASLWTVAGIGMAVAVGGPNQVFVILSIVATLVVFVTLSTMRGFEPGLGKRTPRYIRVETSGESGVVLGVILHQLVGMGVDVQAVQTADAHVAGRHGYRIKIVLPRRAKVDAIVEALAGQAGVEKFDWS
jgi:putative Mg2+ transporter-C (MgtC) family protein